MSAHDISRHLFDPESHYSGLRMQQGRVLLDSDLNEARMIDEEAQRVLVVDVVGPHGSPDSGFTVAAVNTTGTYNFQIGAGTYYLGGYRHEIYGTAGPLSPQTFRAQSNWLQSNRSDVVLPGLPTAARNDLVYLVGWQQGVSFVEDGELREQAIARHDTGYRERRMDRVLVRTSGPGTCKEAFDALVTELTAGGHVFDEVNFELKSNASMDVVADPTTVSADLCKPPVLQGFSGAENQAIRVQLFGPRRLLWSVDNAAPLHRLRVVSTAATTAVIELITDPADHAHLPQVGQILEIVPWGAALRNGQYVADHKIADNIGGGVLTRVLTPYDPSTHRLTVTLEATGSLTPMLDWFTIVPIVPEGDRYLFGRLWNPGDDAAAGPFGIDFEVGEVIPLKGTGLAVSFGHAGITGDYWIVGSRPATPRPVVPWGLEQDARPHGPRRFYSPLAVLKFTRPGATLLVEPHACRRTFRPLTRLRGCCTVTVGDDRTSFGDFSSINAALAALPVNEPARICVLPGEYRERVVVTERENLVIEGCGPRTVLRTPTVNTTSAGLITIHRSKFVTIRNMTIDAVGQFGVMVYGDYVGTTYNYCREIVLENLDITTSRNPGLPPATFSDLRVPAGSSATPLSTIAVYFTVRIKILGCKLTMVGELSAAANVILNQSSYTLIRDCRITTLPGVGGIRRAWGGVQAFGGLHVTIEGCEIAGGIGHGITLGSVSYVGIPETSHLHWFDASGRLGLGDDEDCPGVASDLPEKALPPGGTSLVNVYFVSAPSVTRILRNRIHSMGGSGISVLGFRPETPVLPVNYTWTVHASDLEIADNIIEGNYRRPAKRPVDPAMTHMAAFGGIVLGSADGLRIHDNAIRNNGLNHRWATCGVFVYTGEDVAVENNEIRDNGRRLGGNGPSGVRAGVALRFVGRRISATETDYDVEAMSLMPAARVRGNLIHQPAGRALEIYGLGAMFVEGNVLVSEGLSSSEPTEFGHCIDIQNLGQSPELALDESVPANVGFLPSPALKLVDFPAAPDLIDGRVLFTDNQVHFRPVASAAFDIKCAVRLQSYGDIAVLDNQFMTTFPDTGGSMVTDTKVIAWSVRANNNRWEDPVGVIVEDLLQTEVSASTLGRMNCTALNQGSRCIHVHISPLSPTIANNQIDDNQTYTTCVFPG